MAVIKKSLSSRILHNWVSVVLVLPLFIVGMSTFFMTHENSIGNFVIGYTTEPPELKDILHTRDGRRFFASKNGIYQIKGDEITPVGEMQNFEIRVLEQLVDGRILAAGKNGLWLSMADGQWNKIYDADIHGVQILDQSWHLVTKQKGILISDDQGKTWKNDADLERALLSASDKKPVLLGKFMHDLHTGKALFGKHFEWIWADILALTLVFLSLTGVYMWWRAEKRKTATR